MNRVYGLEDSQVALIAAYASGTIDEETLCEHVPGVTADVWVDLNDELLPSEMEASFERFLQMQNARRITVQSDMSGGEY